VGIAIVVEEILDVVAAMLIDTGAKSVVV